MQRRWIIEGNATPGLRGLITLCWDQGMFKLLGIKLCTDTKEIVNMNYENQLEESSNILRMWTKRQQTQLGKIIILTTLALCKITHPYITLLRLCVVIAS